MDLFDKCNAFTRAEDAMAADLYPYFTPIEAVRGNMVRVRGRDIYRYRVSLGRWLTLPATPDTVITTVGVGITFLSKATIPLPF